MAPETDQSTASGASAHDVREREAALVLGALSRVKARRFGRLVITVGDGRVVDLEVVEKIDRDVLRTLSM